MPDVTKILAEQAAWQSTRAKRPWGDKIRDSRIMRDTVRQLRTMKTSSVTAKKERTMGLMDKLKGAVDAVTGGGADVEISWEPETVMPGQAFDVTVTVKSTGAEVKSEGIFVDVLGEETFMPEAEEIEAVEDAEEIVAGDGVDGLEATPIGDMDGADEDDIPNQESRTVINESYRLHDALVLGADESKVVNGQVTLPAELPPTSAEDLGRHYAIRGRLKAFANDPDSGYKELQVGS